MVVFLLGQLLSRGGIQTEDSGRGIFEGFL